MFDLLITYQSANSQKLIRIPNFVQKMLASHFIDCLHQNSNQATQGLADIIETHLECHQDQLQHSQNEQELVRLRLLLADKEKQIQEKNVKILSLQERCKLTQRYEKKIESLQNKIETLERLLDRLENQQTHAQVSKSLKNTKHHKTVTLSSEQHFLDCQAVDPLGQRNTNNEVRTQKCLVDKNNQKHNKQNRNPSRENKDAEEKDTKKINKSENKILFPTHYEEAISSKFLHIDKEAEEKSKQIDRKFNKIKQNIETKPKSTKNIDEIYSLLNHHSQGTKMRKQQHAIKEINQKLQNILDESVRLNSRGPSPNRKQVQRAHQRYSVRTRPDFRTEHSHLAADEKQKNESFILKGIINNYRPQKSFIFSSRKQKSFTPNEQSMFYNSNLSASTLTKLHNKKLNKILNSTTVNEMLEARKCFNIMGDKRSVLNKSNDYTMDRFERSKAYWG